MPEQVRGDHGVAVGELADDRPPDVRARRDAVDEDDQWPLARPQEADRVAVQLDVLELGLGATACARRVSRTHWIRIPESALEMTRRWISEVPSKIVKIFASRCIRSTGNSRVQPLPPRIWIARSVAQTATSPAFSFDIEPSALLKVWPVRPIHDARQTSSRAASISSFMSASVKAIAWFSMIGLPNWTRSLA